MVVKDTGCGIHEDDKDKLFKLFGTIDRTHNRVNLKGIGLGLVMCKMIVEKFDGGVHFESEQGHGSVFTFRFKLEKDTKEIKDESDSDEEDSHSLRSDSEEEEEKSSDGPLTIIGLQHNLVKLREHKHERILMIDDESYCLLSLKTMMSKALAWSRCDQVMSGEEALDFVEVNHKLGCRYKVIFCDLCMPGLSGIETAEAIFAKLKGYGLRDHELPIIIGLSGHVGDDYKKQAKNAGMRRLEAKPMTFVRLN